jgi:surfactin synthase thioesterase subunit
MPAHHLPREQFLEHLREMGGAPPEFFVEPELVELVLPMLRADFSVAETYTYTPAEPLDVPVRAFCGTADPHVSPAQTAAWGEQTTSRFGLTSVPGGHFFLESERASLLRAIRDDLLDAGRAAPVGERAR